MSSRTVGLLLLAIVACVGVLALVLWSTDDPPGSALDAAPEPSQTTSSNEDDDSALIAAAVAEDSAGRAAPRVAATAPGAIPDEQRAVFAGRVVSAGRFDAVVGATVRLIQGESEVVCESGEDGGFELALLADVETQLEVTHAEFVDVRRPRVALADVRELVLERSGAIDGRLTSSGPETTGVEVALWSYARDRYRGEPVATLETRADGRFEFADLAPGAYAVGVASAGAPVAVETGIEVRPGARTSVELVLGRGATLAGRVTLRGSGDPVPGAHIDVRSELQGVGDDMEERASVHVESGSDGAFRVDGLAPGRAEVRVRAPWGSLLQREVGLVEQSSERVEAFVFAGPARVAGLVRDARGALVSGATVVLARDADAARFGRWQGELTAAEGVLSTTTDGAGRFEFLRAPAREHVRIAAFPAADTSGTTGTQRGSGFGGRFSLAEGEARTDIVLELVDGHAVSGRVVDVDGSPVDGLEVHVWARPARSWMGAGTTVTNADGEFAWASIPAGSAMVVIDTEGYQRVRQRFEVDTGIEPIEVVIEHDLSLSGHVVDPEGWAIPYARVRATSIDPKGEQTRRGATADEFGRFALTSIEAGSWKVAAWASGYRFPEGAAVAVDAPSDAYLILTLEPEPEPAPATLSGEVALAGSGLPLVGLTLNGTRGGSVSLEGTRFRVTGVRPGRCRVVVEAPGVETLAFPVVDLAPGAWVDLGRLETRRTSRMQVEVVGPGGKPLAKAKVRLERRTKELREGVRAPRTLPLEYHSRSASYRAARVGRYDWRLVVEHAELGTHKEIVSVRESSVEMRVQLARK